ncbi:MAG: hypothetical protein ACFWTW_09610 [Lentilactobacillus parabuchneri]|jgi:hypothetical protein|nr:hypothetical protein FAM21809_02481 [Lentilactobacillus parabuchneri]ORN07744.1 hypothetical protein FAM21838_02296 [Lentilactobacillus parabuchneri]ORN12909.1 hypothetical protein FAM23164_02545 [Lentilactobacillus parabuchneri]ORN14799.1 hypothetical protein FAM23165_02553 [Lentilactobacillus parabuchneri]ORN17711.1 hypothetical protein FAM23166_02530 [Lentilactobacillus parabuchneri]
MMGFLSEPIKSLVSENRRNWLLTSKHILTAIAYLSPFSSSSVCKTAMKAS